MNHKLHIWITNSTHESQTPHMDHELHMWIPNSTQICEAICGTGWRRPIGFLKLQVIFCKRATNYRAILRKMNSKGKASYDSTPPCIWTQIPPHICVRLQREPHTPHTNHELFVCIPNLTYTAHELHIYAWGHTWTTHSTHESRSFFVYSEPNIYAWGYKLFINSTYDSQTPRMNHELHMWFTNFQKHVWGHVWISNSMQIYICVRPPVNHKLRK